MIYPCTEDDFCDCGECRRDETASGFGTSKTTPWEDRGIKVRAVAPITNYTKVWPILKNPQFDPVQAASDFYLLESIVNDVPFTSQRRVPLTPPVEPSNNPAKDQHFAEILALNESELEHWRKVRDRSLKPTKLQKAVVKAKSLFTEVVEMADTYLVPYFYIAIGGELRHHVAVRNRILNHGQRSAAWAGWKKIVEEVGDQALLDAAELFREFEEGTSFGGNAWAVPCEVLHARVTDKYGDNFAARQIFVDRAWTLEHNGGCFLNKITWPILEGNDLGGLDKMRTVLNAQAEDPTNYGILMGAASSAVKEVFKTYWQESEKELSESGIKVKGDNDFLNPPPARRICGHCNSNPELGHMAHCYYGWHLDPETLSPEDASTLISPTDFVYHNFDNWVTSEEEAEFKYYFGPDMKSKVFYSLNERFTIRLRYCEGHDDWQYIKWIGTYGEFLNGDADISVNDFNKLTGLSEGPGNFTTYGLKLRINGVELLSHNGHYYHAMSHTLFSTGKLDIRTMLPQLVKVIQTHDNCTPLSTVADHEPTGWHTTGPPS